MPDPLDSDEASRMEKSEWNVRELSVSGKNNFVSSVIRKLEIEDPKFVEWIKLLSKNSPRAVKFFIHSKPMFSLSIVSQWQSNDRMHLILNVSEGEERAREWLSAKE